MAKKKLILNQLDSGCIVPTSHKLNSDGYFRKRSDGKLIMYHRLVWQWVHGLIPDGYEIDHVCKNRACCNISHLQMLSNAEHTVKDNAGRYEDKRQEARNLIASYPNKPMTWIADQIGISFGSVCKWRRDGHI